jgi:hypothetical protein
LEKKGGHSLGTFYINKKRRGIGNEQGKFSSKSMLLSHIALIRANGIIINGKIRNIFIIHNDIIIYQMVIHFMAFPFLIPFWLPLVGVSFEEDFAVGHRHWLLKWMALWVAVPFEVGQMPAKKRTGIFAHRERPWPMQQPGMRPDLIGDLSGNCRKWHQR